MSLLLLAAFVLQTGTPPVDPAALAKTLRTLQNEAQAKASEGKAVDLAAVEADVRSKARAAIAGMDPKGIADADAAAWSPLFRLSGRVPEAIALSERSVRHLATQAWMQQLTLLHDYLAQEDKAKILQTLDVAASAQINMIGQMGEFVIYELAPKYAASDPKLVETAYDVLLRRVNLDVPPSEADKVWRKFSYARLSAYRDLFLAQTGRASQAAADLARVRASVAGDARAEQAVDEVATRIAIVEKRAPEIVAERSIGSYRSLAALRGKVVLLDFFAHWCGPCKRAFPEMRALYSEAKGKGLEIVGVTSLQGYYENRKDLKPDAEFALMRDKFVPEFKLPWPVVFEKGQAGTKAYGVSAIPQLVVIDRAGKVRRIVVGYNPAEFAETKVFVEKLLAERGPGAAAR